MPWSHCDIPFLLDTENCSACGYTKAEWTVECDVTRAFVVPTRTSLSLEVVDAEDERPVPELSWRLELPDGRLKTGELDAQGSSLLKGLPRGLVRLEWTGFSATDFVDGSSLAGFPLQAGKNSLRLLLAASGLEVAADAGLEDDAGLDLSSDDDDEDDAGLELSSDDDDEDDAGLDLGCDDDDEDDAGLDLAHDDHDEDDAGLDLDCDDHDEDGAGLACSSEDASERALALASPPMEC